MADQTPAGEWKWRVIFERSGSYDEVVVKQCKAHYYGSLAGQPQVT
jgi:hypothetical protein